MGYLICEKCKNYYKLKPGEKLEDYSRECECGKKLKYTINFHIDKPGWQEFIIEGVCPFCGKENPEGSNYCAYCGKKIKTLIV